MEQNFDVGTRKYNENETTRRERLTFPSSVGFYRTLIIILILLIAYVSIVVDRERNVIGQNIMSSNLSNNTKEHFNDTFSSNHNRNDTLQRRNDTLQRRNDTFQRNQSQNDIHQNVLPFCMSGNQYLSIKRGGSWIKQTNYIEPPTNETLVEHVKSQYLCYNQGYKEYYEWSPPCMQLSEIAIANATGISASVKNDYNNSYTNSVNISSSFSNNTAPKVLLIGDSLTRQIHNSCLMRSNKTWQSVCMWRGVEYHYFKMFNLVLNSIPFQSQHAPNCVDEIMNFSPKFELDFVSEENFLRILNGFDYVFFNQFPHWRRTATEMYTNCYQQLNISEQVMMEEILHFFELQISRMSDLMRILVDGQYQQGNNNNNTSSNSNKTSHASPRFYYRTSPKHAYEWNPSISPLDDVPESQSRNTCTQDPGQHMWRCADTFNDIGTSAFLASGHYVLDTAPVMNLRVDAHPCSLKHKIASKHYDCLHFCFPGAPGTMLQAIQNEVVAKEIDNEFTRVT